MKTWFESQVDDLNLEIRSFKVFKDEQDKEFNNAMPVDVVKRLWDCQFTEERLDFKMRVEAEKQLRDQCEKYKQ